MKNRKTVFVIVAIFIMITVIFASCKNNDGETVYVTDANGVQVTDSNGEPVTIIVEKKKKKGKDDDRVAYVTDESGSQLTDANGEPITVMPETSVITITDGNGNVVTDENGEPETSIYYKPQQVVVPVTNINHEPVTGENGEVLTTLIWFPANPTTTAVETVTVTDTNGAPVTTPDGDPVTETTIVSSANESFSKTMGGTSGSDEATAIVPNSDGGSFTLISGSSKDGLFSSVANTKDLAFSICKHGKDGSLIWTKAFGASSSVSAQDICATSDGGVVIVGQTRAKDFVKVNGSEYDAFIMKFDKDGNEVFRTPWGGTSNEDFYGVAEGTDGSIYAAGFAYSQDGDAASLKIPIGESRAVIVKFSADGKQEKVTGVCGFSDYFTDIAVAKNGDVFAVASIGASSTQTLFKQKGRSDAAVFKFDKDLNVQFSKLFGGSGIDRFESIAVTNDGGCVIVGASTSNDGDIESAGIKNKGEEDATIVKFTGSGSIAFVQSFYGNKSESFKDVTVTDQGYIIAVGEAQSATRDFATIGNHGGKDAFAVRYDSNGNYLSAIGYGGSGDDSALAVCTALNGQIIVAGSTTSTNDSFSNMQPASDGTKSVAFIRTLSF